MKGLEGMPRWGGIHNQSYLQFQIRYRNRFGIVRKRKIRAFKRNRFQLVKRSSQTDFMGQNRSHIREANIGCNGSNMRGYYGPLKLERGDQCYSSISICKRNIDKREVLRSMLRSIFSRLQLPGYKSVLWFACNIPFDPFGGTPVFRGRRTLVLHSKRTLKSLLLHRADSLSKNLEVLGLLFGFEVRVRVMVRVRFWIESPFLDIESALNLDKESVSTRSSCARSTGPSSGSCARALERNDPFWGGADACVWGSHQVSMSRLSLRYRLSNNHHFDDVHLQLIIETTPQIGAVCRVDTA
eukprot:sb/3467427/